MNCLPKTVSLLPGCDLNPGPSAPESSTHANHSATEPPDSMIALLYLLSCVSVFVTSPSSIETAE